MNRIDRLKAIIIYLQRRQRVTVDELSDRYDISTRTVYRDLRAPQEAETSQKFLNLFLMISSTGSP